MCLKQELSQFVATAEWHEEKICIRDVSCETSVINIPMTQLLVKTIKGAQNDGLF